MIEEYLGWRIIMNHTLVMDFYELTMAQTYFNDGKQNEVVYFDVFFEKIHFMEVIPLVED